MSDAKKLDLILPCYNPRIGWEKTLAVAVKELKTALPEDCIQAVIIVNDGSDAGLTEAGMEQLIADIPQAKLIEYSNNKGKGYAVRTGIRSGASELQIYTDIDVPYSTASIVEFYRVLNTDEVDVVVSSRGNSYYDSLSSFRRILSKSLRWLNGFLFGLRIKDTQGGLKGFNAAGREVFLETRVNRYLFDLEFIQKASRSGLKLKAVEVQLKPDIILPSPSPIILLKELHNFIRLLIFR